MSIFSTIALHTLSSISYYIGLSRAMQQITLVHCERVDIRWSWNICTDVNLNWVFHMPGWSLRLLIFIAFEPTYIAFTSSLPPGKYDTAYGDEKCNRPRASRLGIGLSRRQPCFWHPTKRRSLLICIQALAVDRMFAKWIKEHMLPLKNTARYLCDREWPLL